MRCRKRQKGGKIEPKHLLQYPAQPSPFLGLIYNSCAFTQEIQVLEDINRSYAFYRHIFRLHLQRVIETHVKLNKEDKREGGGARLVVRASDSEARVRVSLLTRVTMLCP